MGKLSPGRANDSLPYSKGNNKDRKLESRVRSRIQSDETKTKDFPVSESKYQGFENSTNRTQTREKKEDGRGVGRA